jgi:hypothetical protein
MKLHTAIIMYLHINPCPIRMQAHENKTQHMLNKTIGDEPLSVSVSVCVCVCVYIVKDKILPFSNYNVRIYNFL